MRPGRTVSLVAARRALPGAADKPDIAIREVGFPALLPLWIVGAYVTLYVVHYYPGLGLAWADSHAYWLTAHRDVLYQLAPGDHDAFVYSPAFAQLFHPFALLPFPLFAGLWTVIEGASFAWLWAPLGWKWAIPLTAVCSIEIGIGNIYGLLAVALVLGLRHPAAIALPALTKITPVVGLVWFVARGEWRRLADAAAIIAAIAAVSYLIAPGQWHAWVRYLVDNRGSDPTVPFHVGAGLMLAVVAARRDRASLLAPAATLASPVIHGWLPIVMVAAIPRLRGLEREHRGARP